MVLLVKTHITLFGHCDSSQLGCGITCGPYTTTIIISVWLQQVGCVSVHVNNPLHLVLVEYGTVWTEYHYDREPQCQRHEGLAWGKLLQNVREKEKKIA